MTTSPPGPPLTEEPTIGRLVADTTKDLSALVRDEIQLAKSEIQVSVKAGGIGAAMFAVAGFLLVLAIIMASFALAYLFVWLGINTALAFLIVFGIYVLIAGIIALIGVKKIKQVKAPEKTISSVKKNKAILKKRG